MPHNPERLISHLKVSEKRAILDRDRVVSMLFLDLRSGPLFSDPNVYVVVLKQVSFFPYVKRSSYPDLVKKAHATI
jgi:hypothetical protein